MSSCPTCHCGNLLLYPPAGLRPQHAFSCILHFIIYTAVCSACVQIRQMLDCHNAFSPLCERPFRCMCLSSRQNRYYYSARYLLQVVERTVSKVAVCRAQIKGRTVLNTRGSYWKVLLRRHDLSDQTSVGSFPDRR